MPTRAFDDAAEHIAKRLRRYRRRVNEHARDSANRERPEAARQYILRQEDEAAAQDGDGAATAAVHATVIAEQVTEISRLSVGEAVMRMDLGRSAGADVPQQHDRRIERRLPPERRQYRLDRPER